MREFAFGEGATGVAAFIASACDAHQLDRLHLRWPGADAERDAARWGEHHHYQLFGQSDYCDGSGGEVEAVYDRFAGEFDYGGGARSGQSAGGNADYFVHLRLDEPCDGGVDAAGFDYADAKFRL